MSFKTELHCHSYPVSRCAHFSPEELAEHYITAGYTTVVLTNHFYSSTFDPKRYSGAPDWSDKVAYFMEDYRRMERAAGERLHVLLGAELRLDAYATTDYLVYGVNEERLRAMDGVFEERLKDCFPRIRAMGCMIYQAHPFRNGMHVTPPELLDGLEVYNATPRALDRNAFALLWADTYGLKKIAGTDFHARGGVEFPRGEHANSGILTDAPITTNDELLAVLQSGNYELLCGES